MRVMELQCDARNLMHQWDIMYQFESNKSNILILIKYFKFAKTESLAFNMIKKLLVIWRIEGSLTWS